MVGVGPPCGGQASGKHNSFLLADDSAHLADGLHGADQVLHSHFSLPPKSSLLFI
jgi:hypothetical protein